MLAKISYAIVALGLSEKEVADITKAATGVTVDGRTTDFLHRLGTSQLEAIWKRLSEDRRWAEAP